MKALAYQPNNLADKVGKMLYLLTASGKLLAVTGGVPAEAGIIWSPEEILYAVTLSRRGLRGYIEAYSPEKWILVERVSRTPIWGKRFRMWLEFGADPPVPDGWVSFQKEGE